MRGSARRRSTGATARRPSSSSRPSATARVVEDHLPDTGDLRADLITMMQPLADHLRGDNAKLLTTFAMERMRHPDLAEEFNRSVIGQEARAHAALGHAAAVERGELRPTPTSSSSPSLCPPSSGITRSTTCRSPPTCSTASSTSPCAEPRDVGSSGLAAEPAHEPLGRRSRRGPSQPPGRTAGRDPGSCRRCPSSVATLPRTAPDRARSAVLSPSQGPSCAPRPRRCGSRGRTPPGKSPNGMCTVRFEHRRVGSMPSTARPLTRGTACTASSVTKSPVAGTDAPASLRRSRRSGSCHRSRGSAARARRTRRTASDHSNCDGSIFSIVMPSESSAAVVECDDVHALTPVRPQDRRLRRGRRAARGSACHPLPWS